MAYGLHYTIPFLNREQDACIINISEKDYVDGTTTLKGSSRPFTLSSQAQDNTIPYGICSTEAVIEFYTGGLVSLIDFYSEDDTHWLVQFYYQGSLTWTGYLQLDNSSERITDQNHTLSLNANDGTGRLQTLYLTNDDGTAITLNWTLADLLSYIFAFIPTLDIYAWLNIFENSTTDRSGVNYLTFIPQTAFNTRYFQNSDGTTQDLYTILNSILFDFRSCLRQTKGVWQIIRWGDVRIFSDGTMPGTDYNGFIGSYSEIFFPESIDVGRNLARYPINENQINRILRPYQFTKETFNYGDQFLISQANLQIALGATPYATTTIGNFRYDDYLLATYFPLWKQINDDASYLEIVTDVSGTPEREVDRYIVTPCCTPTQSGVQFDYIPVSAQDNFDISLGWRTDTDTDDTLNFYLRITLITETHYYGLDNVGFASGLGWNGPFLIANYATDNSTGFLFQNVPSTGSIDTTQWMSFSLSSFLVDGAHLPLNPADGILLIEVCGTNGDVVTNTQGTFWKDISLQVNEFINSSLQITGQFHNQSQDEGIRNNLQYDTVLDDSPRNTINGTLFTNAVTTFAASIGGIYFTKTSAWHRQGVSESRRLGDLNTFNDLFIQRKTRTIVEGDFHGLHDVNLMSLINLPDKFPGKKFIFGTARFDYMECIWTATLYELFEDGEVDGDLDNTYLFNYLYNNG